MILNSSDTSGSVSNGRALKNLQLSSVCKIPLEVKEGVEQTLSTPTYRPEVATSRQKLAKITHVCVMHAVMLVWGLLFRTAKAAYANMYIEIFAIYLTFFFSPSEERFNRDGGLKVPGCWITVMNRQGGRSNPHRPLTSDDVYPQ